MKRRVWLALLLLILVPAASPALEWCVEGFNFTRSSAVPIPDGRVIGSGYHTLTVVDTDLWNLIIRFRIASGKLSFYGGVMNRCSSGWIYPHGPDDTFTSCFTYTEIQPCYQGEGLWDVWTVGELEGSNSGRKTSLPKVLRTECFC